MAVADFVVIHRIAAAAAWQVQPFVWPKAKADIVGQELVNRYGGEAQSLPIEIMQSVDARD